MLPYQAVIVRTRVRALFAIGRPDGKSRVGRVRSFKWKNSKRFWVSALEEKSPDEELTPLAESPLNRCLAGRQRIPGVKLDMACEDHPRRPQSYLDRVSADQGSRWQRVSGRWNVELVTHSAVYRDAGKDMESHLWPCPLLLPRAMHTPGASSSIRSSGTVD